MEIVVLPYRMPGGLIRRNFQGGAYVTGLVRIEPACKLQFHPTVLAAVEGARGPPTSKRENFFICTAMIP